VSWSIIPAPQSTEADQLAAARQMCWQATSRIDTYVHQVLRATVNTEYPAGPGMPRCNVDPDTGNGVLIMKRWPVTEVLAIQTSPARSFPAAWTPVPAGQWRIRHPLVFSGDSAAPTGPDGSWTVDVAPGYISWQAAARRRGGLLVQASHVNGWPHTSLTEDAPEGAETLYVDDVTGWAGAAGFAYDGGATEQAVVASVTANTAFPLPNGAGFALSGPGMLTLSSPLQYQHEAGTVVSALPATVIESAVYAAAIQALEGGIDSVTIQTLTGEKVSSGSGISDIATEMELLLDPFKRVI